MGGDGNMLLLHARRKFPDWLQGDGLLVKRVHGEQDIDCATQGQPVCGVPYLSGILRKKPVGDKVPSGDAGPLPGLQDMADCIRIEQRFSGPRSM